MIMKHKKNPAPAVRSTVLLVCPFCGHVGELAENYRGWWGAGCNNPKCEVSPHTDWWRTKGKAMRLWNTRHAEPMIMLKWARLTANECNRVAVKAEHAEATRLADALWQAAGCLLDAAHILRA